MSRERLGEVALAHGQRPPTRGRVARHEQLPTWRTKDFDGGVRLQKNACTRGKLSRFAETKPSEVLCAVVTRTIHSSLPLSLFLTASRMVLPNILVLTARIPSR